MDPRVDGGCSEVVCRFCRETSEARTGVQSATMSDRSPGRPSARPPLHQPDRQSDSAEVVRLREDARREKNWKRWGPYLAERQWGTVREDYSADGNAWDYFTH